MATQDYLVELDDDVIEAPPRWDETMLDAFLRIPKIGFLSASLVDDPNDSASRYIKYLREERKAYTRRELNGVAILEGPTGGSCTMTSRELYERVGGFRQNAKFVYWREDAAYVKDLRPARVPLRSPREPQRLARRQSVLLEDVTREERISHPSKRA